MYLPYIFDKFGYHGRWLAVVDQKRQLRWRRSLYTKEDPLKQRLSIHSMPTTIFKRWPQINVIFDRRTQRCLPVLHVKACLVESENLREPRGGGWTRNGKEPCQARPISRRIMKVILNGELVHIWVKSELAMSTAFFFTGEWYMTGIHMTYDVMTD